MSNNLLLLLLAAPALVFGAVLCVLIALNRKLDRRLKRLKGGVSWVQATVPRIHIPPSGIGLAHDDLGMISAIAFDDDTNLWATSSETTSFYQGIDDVAQINPATGLPMLGGIDTGGSPFGFDVSMLHWDSGGAFSDMNIDCAFTDACTSFESSIGASFD